MGPARGTEPPDMAPMGGDCRTGRRARRPQAPVPDPWRPWALTVGPGRGRATSPDRRPERSGAARLACQRHRKPEIVSRSAQRPHHG